MAIQIKNTYSGRTDNTDTNYPYGKGRNVIGGVEGTGTPFEAQWYNNLEGFLQGLLLEAGITPDGQVDNANSSQLVEAVKGLGKSASKVSTKTDESVQDFIDTFALKIFQSPTDGGLTEIQTRTVDAGEVYEVRKTSDDSLATIYSDAAGTTEIVQDGTDNKSGSNGVVEFYIACGDYYILVGGVKSNFKLVPLEPFKTVSDMKAADLSGYPEGTRIEWQGYYEQSDGGGNWGVLKFGDHTEDGGSVFSIDSNTYVEANLKGAIDIRKFGASPENADNYSFIEKVEIFCFESGGYIKIGIGDFNVSETLVVRCDVKGVDWYNSKIKSSAEIGIRMAYSGIEIRNISVEGLFEIGETVMLNNPPTWQSNPYYTTSGRDRVLTSNFTAGIKHTWRSNVIKCRITKFHRGIFSEGIHSHHVKHNRIEGCEIAMYSVSSGTGHKVLVSIVEDNEIFNCWFGNYGTDLINMSFRNNLYEPVLTASYIGTMSYCSFENEHVEEAYEGYYFDSSQYNKSATVKNFAYLGNRSPNGLAITNKSINPCWVFGETLPRSYYQGCKFDSDSKAMTLDHKTLELKEGDDSLLITNTHVKKKTLAFKNISASISAYFQTSQLSLPVARFFIGNSADGVCVVGDMVMNSNINPNNDIYKFSVNLVGGVLYSELGAGIVSASLNNDGGGVYTISLNFSGNKNYTRVVCESNYYAFSSNDALPIS